MLASNYFNHKTFLPNSLTSEQKHPKTQQQSRAQVPYILVRTFIECIKMTRDLYRNMLHVIQTFIQKAGLPIGGKTCGGGEKKVLIRSAQELFC